MSLGGRSKGALGFPRSRASEPHDKGLCLKGSCSLFVPCCRDPAACFRLGPGTLGKLFQTCVVPGLDTWRAQGRLHGGPLGRGCRPRVRACGCVHERGPGATHTHTHTLTRPHPLRALGRAAHVSWTSTPTPGPPGSRARAKSIAKAFSLTQRAGFGGQKEERWGVAPPPRCPRPPGEGNAERVPGALTAQAAECGRERPAGPAPPRRQGRRGRGWRAGPEGTRG